MNASDAVKVLHISPTFFDETSYIGGAERYTWELARAMARKASVELVTFGPERKDVVRDGVRIQTLRRMPIVNHPLASNPFTPRFLSAVGRADVVHCHQVNVLSTNVAVLAGRLLGRPVFVSDLGGGDVYAPSNYLPIMRLATGYLLLSEYSRSLWEAVPRSRRPARLEVVYGGVDTDVFSPGGEKEPGMVLFVGRMLPHKGLEYLIDAIEPPLTLRLVGRPYDQDYLALLKDRARDKPVIFEHDVDDRGIVERYRKALAFVLPSVSTDFRGKVTATTELFGLVLAEAMACGTPTIVTREASHPEMVKDGVTGLIVPPADAGALRAALLQLNARPDLSAAMGQRARADVLSRFTWDATADRCLAAYDIGRRR